MILVLFKMVYDISICIILVYFDNRYIVNIYIHRYVYIIYYNTHISRLVKKFTCNIL